MDGYINVLHHSGVMLVDMDALTVNSNHVANDPARNPGATDRRWSWRQRRNDADLPLLAL
jgi:hypothetical protein